MAILRLGIRRKVATARILSSAVTGYRVPVRAIKSIDLEPIAACNLKCTFCRVPGWRRARETRPMDLDLFIKILDQFPNLQQIKIQGMGEPFMNKNLVSMIEFASVKNIETFVITNGTLLNSNLIQQVLDAGLSRLCFSLDGGTKETFEKIRVNSNFQKVIENIKISCDLKRQKNAETCIEIRSLACTIDVFNEIPSMVRMVGQLGVDKIVLTEKMLIWSDSFRDGRIDDRPVYLDEFSDYTRVIDEAYTEAKKYDVELSVGQTVYSSKKPCSWPWGAMYVTTEGKVTPCCVIGVPEIWCMGDLQKESLEDIWNNSAYRELRKQISSNKIPKLCEPCYQGIKDKAFSS